MKGPTVATWLVTALLVAPGGCTAVVLVEDSESACTNGKDDDGDGTTDCADPSCDGSGVCEGTEEACGNSLDDDDDGLIDCQEPTCQEQGYCDSFVADCEINPQGGCPEGMGCYRRAKGTTAFETRCRSAGLGKTGALCNLADIDALRSSDPHPCAVGFGCSVASAVGTCGAYCQSDADCLTGGLCYPRPEETGVAGLCTTPCDPRVAGTCGADLSCVSLHELGDTFSDGGARWVCVDASLSRGQAEPGDACEDGPSPSTPASEVCNSTSACIPDVGNAGTATCLKVCDIADPNCEAGEVCETLYPTSAPSAVNKTVFGVCR